MHRQKFWRLYRRDVFNTRSYDEHFNNGKYSEFVDEVKVNSDYIIATTIKIDNNKKEYWIIDKRKKLRTLKDSSFILGPFDINSFLEERKNLVIKLNFP